MRKSKGVSLKKNFSWMFASNLFFTASQWGILISISRLGTVEMVGQYTLGLAIISPILMLTNLSTSTIYITDQIKAFKYTDYFSLRLFTSLFSVIILSILLFFVELNMTTLLAVLFVSIYKISESISGILYATMQKKEYVSHVAISKVIKGALSLASISIILYITNSLILGLLGVIIIYVLTLLFYDLRIATKFESVKITFAFSNFYNITKIAIPLGILNLLISLNTNIPRYFVQYYFDVEILGYFAAISYMVVNNINVFTTALRSFVIPRFSKLLYNNRFSEAKSLLHKFEWLGLMLGIISITVVFLFGEWLLVIIYGYEYAEYTNIFHILILSTIFIFISSFHSFFITSARYFKIQPILGVIWVVFSLILGSILIPLFGLEGAAYSVVVVSAIQLITRYVLLRKVFKDLKG